jgi:hypothetical protein
MDPKSLSATDTTVDSTSQMKTEADFLSQAGQVRVALEQLSTVLGWNNPSEPMIAAAMEQIMKSIVCPHDYLSKTETNKLLLAPVQQLSQIHRSSTLFRASPRRSQCDSRCASQVLRTPASRQLP